eukprot:7074467-Prymnesium_polylepis.3
MSSSTSHSLSRGHRQNKARGGESPFAVPFEVDAAGGGDATQYSGKAGGRGNNMWADACWCCGSSASSLSSSTFWASAWHRQRDLSTGTATSRVAHGSCWAWHAHTREWGLRDSSS